MSLMSSSGTHREKCKLINKYTQKKMEILRGIFDQSNVGIVIAGEPRLETELKGNLARFANRMDFYYKLKGLSKNEVVLDIVVLVNQLVLMLTLFPDLFRELTEPDGKLQNFGSSYSLK